MNIYIKGIFLFIAVTICLGACSNDFELTAEKKEIPVVYALLDASDTAQYFRVERAFIDENISAIELAQRPDSLYYENATVTVTRLSTQEEFVFTRVDGTLEGYPRENGAFATVPNYLYKIKTDDIALVTEEDYQLTINLGDGQEPMVATTTLMKPPNLSTPQTGGNIAIDPRKKINYSWNAFGGSTIYDSYITFYYDEIIDNVSTPKQMVWPLVKNFEGTELDIAARGFFTLLGNSLESNPNIRRREQGADFTLVSGGQELSDYIRIGQANLGITSSGEVPVYEGSFNRGLGIFSSRFTINRTDLSLTPITRDSLENGPFTGDLGFE